MKKIITLFVLLLALFFAGCECNTKAAGLVDAATKVEEVAAKAGVSNLSSGASALYKGATNAGSQVAQQSAPLMAVLARGMEKAGGYIEQAVDFTVEQAPIVVQEYATWTFVTGLIWAFAWLVPLILAWALAVYIWRAANKHNLKPDDDGNWWACRVIPTIIVALSLFLLNGMCHNLEEAAKAKFAPRVLLIEKAVELYKQ